jgi:Fe-S-cluster containining protein
LNLELPDFLAFAQHTGESVYNFRLDSSEREFCVILRMREMPDSSRQCIFALDLPNRQMRCGIYPLRPIACQAYPYAFVGHEVEVKPGAFCPKGTTDLGRLDQDSWRDQLGRHDMEFCIYAFIVAKWNESARNKPEQGTLNFRAVMSFLMNVYENLEVARATIPVEEWSGIWGRWRQFTARKINPLSLRESDTKATTVWSWWRQSIEEAVVEASRDVGLVEAVSEKLPEVSYDQ